TSPVHSCAALRDLPSFPTRRSSDLLPLLMLSLGMAWLLAAVGVFLRDIGQLSAFAVTTLLFASAVMFPATLIALRSPELWTVLRLNPLLQIVDLARNVVLWHQPMPFGWLAYI